MILLIAISQFKENLYCSIFLNLLRSAENENSLNIPIEKYTCILRLPPKRTRWLLFLFFKTRADVNYIWLKIKRFSNGFFFMHPPPLPQSTSLNYTWVQEIRDIYMYVHSGAKSRSIYFFFSPYINWNFFFFRIVKMKPFDHVHWKDLDWYIKNFSSSFCILFEYFSNLLLLKFNINSSK